MKYYLLVFSIISLFVQCKNDSVNPKSIELNTASTLPVLSDSAVFADLIHHFYAWYDTMTLDTNHIINFVNDKGKYPTLDTIKLKIYLDYIKSSGYVSDQFIASDMAFYKKCEQYWKNENKAEVLSCLDGDKYFCAQDWDIKQWTTGPITIVYNVNDSAFVRLTIPDPVRTDERNISLQKVNGTWYIHTIECDLGENYD